jgi:hypothetical protein
VRHAVCTLYAMEFGLVALGLAPALVLLLQGGRLVWPFIFLVGAFVAILLVGTRGMGATPAPAKPAPAPAPEP